MFYQNLQSSNNPGNTIENLNIQNNLLEYKILHYKRIIADTVSFYSISNTIGYIRNIRSHKFHVTICLSW